MFSVRANASKLALIHLARGLSAGGFTLIDCQVGNPHLASMGATEIPRTAFLEHLAQAREQTLPWPTSAISAMVGSNVAITPAP